MTDESNHSDDRIFLVVVDESEEMHVALRFACRRAEHTGGRVALLYVVEQADFQHWMAVGDLMREEARSEGEQLLGLIEEEPSISILVLGANTGRRGPGPLIEALTGRFLSKLAIPMTIVPGNLDDDSIDKIS